MFSETLQPIIGADDANHAVADEGAVVEHERFGIPRLVRRVDVVGFNLGDLHGVNVSSFQSTGDRRGGSEAARCLDGGFACRSQSAHKIRGWPAADNSQTQRTASVQMDAVK